MLADHPLPLNVQRALRLADSTTVSEWVDGNVVLDSRAAAESGPFKTARTPYLREIQDCFADSQVEQITILASTQVGKTTVELNCLSWAIDQRPGPALFVLPSEDLARRFAKTRLRPQIEGSPVLRGHLLPVASAVQRLEFNFDRMDAIFAWAGSPATVSSQPICYLFLDEIDKYPPATARESNPLSLARERTRTFWFRKIIAASTPTIPDGPIMQEWSGSDQRQFFVPCPHCGAFQTLEMGPADSSACLVFADDPDERSPSKIRSGRLSWYKCRECGGRIDDRDKPAMLAAGEWRSTTEDADQDGSHVGFKLNCFYSPWLTFSEISAKFLEARRSEDLMQNFVNSWLAETWEDRVWSASEGALSRVSQRDGLPRGVLPAGTVLLTIGVDWHGAALGLYWVVWAWTSGRHAWLVDYGVSPSEELLLEATLHRAWRSQDKHPHSPRVGVDCSWGVEAHEVYEFCRPFFPAMRPVKGDDSLQRVSPLRESPIEARDRRGRKNEKGHTGYTCLHVCTGYYKDMLATYINSAGREVAAELEADDVQEEEGADMVEPGGRLHLCRGTDRSFQKSLVSQHKVRDRRTKRLMWKVKYEGINDHYLDATVYAWAIAEFFGLASLSVEREVAGKVRKGGGKGKWLGGGRGGGGGSWLKGEG